MSLGIIIGQKAAGVTGNLISTNYANKRFLSSIILNEGGFISSLASDVFVLPAGSYRIKSSCCNCNSVGLGAQQLFVHKLFNQTDGSDLFVITGVVSAISTGFKASTPARTTDIVTNVWTYHTGFVTLVGNCSIYIASKTNSVTLGSGALPVEGKPVNLGEFETYTIIEILKTA